MFRLMFQLLEDLALQQIQLEQELEKVQQERDTNRARLLSYIYNGTISVLLDKLYKAENTILIKWKPFFFPAEKEADNVIMEFLRNSEEERQSQAELLEREKQEEMRLLSSCHSEQFMLRTKDTLCEHQKKKEYIYVASLFAYEYINIFVLQLQWKNCWKKRCERRENWKNIPNTGTIPHSHCSHCQ